MQRALVARLRERTLLGRAILLKKMWRLDMNEIAEGIARGLEGKSFEASLKFDCGTEGVLILRDGGVTTEDGPTDCTLKISKENLGKLLTGKLNAMTGVMTGKLKASGDLSVAMRLVKLL